MLYFLISFVSFLILSKSFTSKPLPLGFWGNPSSLPIFRIKKGSSIGFSFFNLPLSMSMPLKKKKKMNNLVSKVDDEGDGEEEEGKISLLDLPELPLDCILERLSPSDVCSVASVCKSLRERCQSDYLWEKHIMKKWGKVIGDSARRQWRSHIASKNRENSFNQLNQKGLFASLYSFRPFLGISSKSENSNSGSSSQPMISSPNDSIMSLYLSLTSGKFWFPAQVYNRENGHAGFMLSCYDAQLCYDSRTDTFQARYSPHGRWATEENIQWHRLRMPPIDISPQTLHISECLADLRPGDHIEIQWRRNREFPYGWWYGVIGHLESCPGHGNHCHCYLSDTVILEFKQYSPGSRWRQTVINRKHHIEEGNEVDGFYGGIRKIKNEDEITRWNNLWPTRIVE